MAASEYNKLSGKIAVCLTITGPGATKVTTGLYNAKEVDPSSHAARYRAGGSVRGATEAGVTNGSGLSSGIRCILSDSQMGALPAVGEVTGIGSRFYPGQRITPRRVVLENIAHIAPVTGHIFTILSEFPLFIHISQWFAGNFTA